MKQGGVNRGEVIGSRVAIERMYSCVQDLQVFLCTQLNVSDDLQGRNAYLETGQWRHQE